MTDPGDLVVGPFLGSVDKKPNHQTKGEKDPKHDEDILPEVKFLSFDNVIDHEDGPYIIKSFARSRCKREKIMQDDLNYQELDSGIRNTVRLIRENGFCTIDSGDGSKVGFMEGDLEIPMVAIMVDPNDLISESHRLLQLLAVHGLEIEPNVIEARYDPVTKIATILLLGISDQSFKEGTIQRFPFSQDLKN